MAGSQDMFDAIVMADERFHGEGYQEGYEEGSTLGIIEGRQHGTLHGAKIGSEIGCYQGFAFAWRCLLHTCAAEKDSKKMKVLESLIGLIEKFPYDDPTYDKLHEDLDRIRGKFKQVCPPVAPCDGVPFPLSWRGPGGSLCDSSWGCGCMRVVRRSNRFCVSM
uniref:LTO1 maturation factor of ABCE1 n=1 Tax=Equus caballus TaxID=9796 RepID=F7E0B2_HORSE